MRKYKHIPDKIKEYLHYNEHTGDLTWIKRLSRNTSIGNVAGCKDSEGYSVIRFEGSAYKAHRIAWFLHTGEQPTEVIDHIDGDKLNNTFNNIRKATKSQNEHNRGKRSNNTSGYKGVYLNKQSGKWRAQINVDSKRKLLGNFDTAKEAHQAYCKAADEFHKQFKNYGGI